MTQLGFEDPKDYERLRQFFEKANYVNREVRSRTGIKRALLIGPKDAAPLRWATRGGDLLDQTIRTFLIGDEIDESLLQPLFELVPKPRLIDAGLMSQVRSNTVVSNFHLAPFEDWYLAYDFSRRRRESDYVMGESSSSMMPINTSVRKPSRSTWDLGTGSGIVALAMAGHSDHVIGTDTNKRAIGVARFNATLNELFNVQFSEGPGFQPVSEQTFDQIIGNLPFVISPGETSNYRSSGLAGDSFCEQIVRQIPPFLNEGGFCQINCNWLVRDATDPGARLQEWVDRSGCDTLVWYTTEPVEDYARHWIRETGTDESWDDDFARWMNYFDELGITDVGLGFVQLRKRETQSNWFHAEPSPKKFNGLCGKHVLARFGVEDRIRAFNLPGDILEESVVPTPALSLEQSFERQDNTWGVKELSISLRSGPQREIEIDGKLFQLLNSLDGSRPLKTIVREIAEAANLDADAFSEAGIPLVQKLLREGFVQLV